MRKPKKFDQKRESGGWRASA